MVKLLVSFSSQKNAAGSVLTDQTESINYSDFLTHLVQKYFESLSWFLKSWMGLSPQQRRDDKQQRALN